MRSLLLSLALCTADPLAAQVTLLKARLDRQCIFTGGQMDGELYRFTDDSPVPRWVAEILEATGESRNFELVEASVENVSVVVDDHRRYLLYSLDFMEKAARIEVYGALAHAVGHHVQEHTLLPENRVREESEADFFMGYFLGKKGFSREVLAAFLQKSPSSYEKLEAHRQPAALAGFEKAERALQFRSLAVDDDPKAQEYLLPTFSFKKCHSHAELPRSAFSAAATLGKVDEKLRLALDTRGYYNRSYFSVKNGFALVCQMEQYNRAEATIRNDRTRWLDYPVRDNFSSLWDGLSTLVAPQKGYFRLFVFVVTDQPFSASPQKVSKTEAAEWLSRGGNRLPEGIKKMPFSGAHTVSALVYEFEVPQSNHRPVLVCPTPLHSALVHLRKSGLGAGLGM